MKEAGMNAARNGSMRFELRLGVRRPVGAVFHGNASLTSLAWLKRRQVAALQGVEIDSGDSNSYAQDQCDWRRVRTR
jgi:hypothetical protein